MLENDFERGKIDSTLFIKRVSDHILLIQVYVDEIIFGSTDNSVLRFCKYYVGRIWNVNDEWIDILPWTAN